MCVNLTNWGGIVLRFIRGSAAEALQRLKQGLGCANKHLLFVSVVDREQMSRGDTKHHLTRPVSCVMATVETLRTCVFYFYKSMSSTSISKYSLHPEYLRQSFILGHSPELSTGLPENRNYFVISIPNIYLPHPLDLDCLVISQ